MLPRRIIPSLLFAWLPVAASFTAVADDATPDPPPPQVLRHSKDVLALSNADAARALRIDITGVVTAADSTWESKFFIQDETGGVFVGDNKGVQPHPGDLVEVEGASGAGGFAPYISNPHWRVLGQRPLPAAKSVSIERIVAGAEDGQRVEVAGLIRAARRMGNRLQLEIMAQGHRMAAEIDRPGDLDQKTLIATKVRFPAVVSASQFKTNSRQLVAVTLFLNSAKELSFEGQEATDPFSVPPLPLSQIGEFRRDGDPERRVHVRGVISFMDRGVIYLADSSGGLEVRTEDSAGLKLGEMAEAAGFSELADFLPVLSDSTVRQGAQKAQLPVAKTVSAKDLAQGLHHADFVQVTGRLLERSWKPSTENAVTSGGAPCEVTLVMQSEGVNFTANFHSESLPEKIPESAIGGLLELHGISLATASARGSITGFRLQVPSLAEVRVLQRPSPLTRERLLASLSGALAILAVVAVWSVVLTRRNARLTAKVREKKAIMAERARLALDLHDTLQQALYGVRLQLDAVREYVSRDDTQALQHLKRAGHFVEQTDAELRRTLWNLRPAALGDFDLAEALRRSACLLSDASGLQIEAQALGRPRPLPAQIEENVLRVSQEALTNALKHGRAKRVQVTLIFAADELVLEITDDGCGFDPAHLPPERSFHFGLEAMRERADRLGGDLQIESAPGEGTSLRLRVPLTQLEAAARLPASV